MDNMEKIIDKLKKLRNELQDLKKVHHTKGKEKYKSIVSLLERIIYRTYPEKDAKLLICKLHILRGLSFEKLPDSEEQNEYVYDVNLALKVINTILEEYELFGFDDFKPIKEKTETETGIKAGPFSYRKKKMSV